MKNIFIIALFCLLFTACEKDDICDAATVTTPKVVITFYDKVAISELKKVVNLSVNATNYGTLSFNDVNTIKIPLQTSQDATIFNFVKNGADTDSSNDVTDVLSFAYTREQLFVSRACGYKTIFNLTNSNTDILVLGGTDWIDHVEIIKPKIETENETHIKIYF